MSMTASAVEGMTFGPMPAWSIVGTSDVRSDGIVLGFVFGEISLGRC